MSIASPDRINCRFDRFADSSCSFFSRFGLYELASEILNRSRGLVDRSLARIVRHLPGSPTAFQASPCVSRLSAAARS